MVNIYIYVSNEKYLKIILYLFFSFTYPNEFKKNKETFFYIYFSHLFITIILEIKINNLYFEDAILLK